MPKFSIDVSPQLLSVYAPSQKGKAGVSTYLGKAWKLLQAVYEVLKCYFSYIVFCFQASSVQALKAKLTFSHSLLYFRLASLFSNNVSGYLKFSSAWKLPNYSLPGHSKLSKHHRWVRGQKVDKFAKRIFNNLEKLKIEKRDLKDAGHSKQWLIKDPKSDRILAILKKSDPLKFSSFTKAIPDMKPQETVYDKERWGHELLTILGKGDVSPITLTGAFSDSGIPSYGSLQLFLSGAFPGRKYFYPLPNGEGGKQLKGLPKASVQEAALLSILLGRGAGMGDNTMMDPKKGQVFLIDLEEIFIRLNRIISSTKVKSGEEPLRKILTTSRIWLLGLPQCNKPTDASVVKNFLKLPLEKVIESFFKSRKLASMKQAKQAMLDRVKTIRQAFKEKKDLTLREVYFVVHGGQELYKEAMKQKIHPLDFFDQVAGNPYPNLPREKTFKECIAKFKPKYDLKRKPRGEQEKRLYENFKVLA